jgi:Metal-dependent hydrolase
MSELKSTKCNASLPVSLCLRDKLDATNFSTACRKKLFPCQIKSGRDSRAACQESKIFSQKLNGDEIDRMEDILDRIDKASQMGVNCNSSEPLLFWMTAGSIMGSLIHHSVIPWDDDVDIFVVEEHINFFKENLEVLGLKTVPMKAEGHEDRVIKIFNPSNPTLRKRHTFTFPFIDMFVVRCSDDTKECVEFKSKKKHLISYDDLFPLKRRPFGALSMPFPAKSDTHCMKRYGQNYKSLCVRGSFDHKRDIWLGRDSTVVMNCSDMMLAFPMVTKQEQSPFEHDFPFMTIEQLVDGTGSQLQTVIFDDGNEVRRIYAENLIGLQDNKISYTLQYPENSNTHLLPYLLEERQRFLENPMEKTSEELNMEVMPMLNKVVISNHHGKASDNLRNKRNLYLGEWNAERGSNWQVFQDFYPKADIIILNEMDWGMARSQNIHTTEIMASSLKMNYAYGVEFLELTNGNQAEQNATRNEENLIGYHGNVVLSKWPIIKSSIIRLHPLHDLLYKEKNSGQAKGERRLGGRMALFTVTSTGIGDILVISMHAHSGSKGHLLKQDAITVCNSIEDWNVSNVLIGGDIANPIPQYLASTCGFYDLNKTNSFSLKKNKFVPTWRLGK